MTKYKKGENFKSFIELCEYFANNEGYYYFDEYGNEKPRGCFDYISIEGYANYAPAIEIKEREKITMYECVDKYGDVKYLTSKFESVKDLSGCSIGYSDFKKLPNGRTFEIYADDYSFIEEVE